MTPAKLATLKHGDILVQPRTGNRFVVTANARTDQKGNPYAWAKSFALIARISTSDCEHFRIHRRAAR